MSSSESQQHRYDVSIFDTPFKSLPIQKRVWLGTPGSQEEGLGRLNILTPEVVAEAAKSEIRTGIRVSLGWDLTKLEHSQFGRQKCKHEIIPLGGDGSGPVVAFDDSYSMNPQQSSQWDGFRHYSQPKNPQDPSSSLERSFYGGTSKDEILDRSNHRIGLQSWAKAGIAGRGILLDYASYAAANGIKYTNFSTHSIPFSTLLTIAKSANIVPQRGDILFIRMGVIPEWENEYSAEQKLAYSKLEAPEHAGVEANLEVLEWIWDSGIAAVAGDMISWEVYPTPGAVSMHEYLLAGWGCPIGELFDLEALARTCASLNRYSFFVTSMPLNMPGGVSSPPNAMAIF